jgi:deazaflavin-dependent oxidoreductase (nitroreductase family)
MASPINATSLTNALGARMLRNRRLVRAPIWLYRHRLGWLLGNRILMLEHVGRTSGLPRYVCLEVVDRPSPTTLVVVSGFGARADWYRNLAAHPECRVSTGRRRGVPTQARLMSDDEAAAALAQYQRAHPRAWDQLRGVIEHAVGHPVVGLPMVELTLATG